MITLFVWTGIFASSLVWNYYLLDKQARELVRNEADTHFNNNQAFRKWGTLHGGVYVPITERTQPSPYMAHIPERDIETPSGKKLTLMNPTYMARQLMEDNEGIYGIRGKITGLITLRPGNEPDAWERKALLALKEGAKAVREFSELDGKISHRMMQPIYMTKGCVKCHGHLGFKDGDFRGGLGISVPAAPFFKNRDNSFHMFAISHAVIWMLGLGGVGLAYRQISTSSHEQSQAEAASLRVQAKFANVLQIAPEAIISLNSDMEIEVFNKGAERIFGHTSSEAVGQHLNLLLPVSSRETHQSHVDAFCNKPDLSYSIMDSEQTQIRGLRKDGSEFPVSASFSKLLVENEMIFTVFLRDVTHQHRIEEDRKHALYEAKKANDTKSEFLASMSHELRTPLNAISGFSQVIAGQYFGAIESPKYLEYSQDIKNSSEHLLSLVDDILDISALEVGKKEIFKETFDLNKGVAEFIHLITNSAKEKEINLVIDLAEGLPQLTADQRAFKQIFVNLLTNAVKFTPKGGEVSLSVKVNVPDFIFVVTDNGAGIEESSLPGLTEPFTRGNKDPYLAQEGTGLGLSIVQSLISLHEGTLDIQSVFGEGTVVTVTLPAGEA